ncbi:MAG: signal peptide peptidase SppA [Pirellulales bacterium]|nr:signal peptide peptidase SppA [Pirellulales bacterium]
MDNQPHPEGHPEPPMAISVAESRPPGQPSGPKSRPLARLLLLLLVLGLGGSLLLNVLLLAAAGLARLGSLDSSRKVQERFFSHEPGGRDKVAILSLEGTILSGEGFIKDQIDRAVDDPDVKAVVLRVDSPGGTITGSDYIYHHLCRLRDESEVPIVVSMGGLAASGGYYVSMACGDDGAVFAEPTTWTGSIGVIIPHYNLSELLGKWGVEEDSIASHPLKQIGSFAKPMTDEERKILQELVDESFTQFKDVIKEGRPAFRKDPEALDALATGQIYSAQQALEHGLIDKIGFLEDAVEKAIELAKLDEKDVEVVRYHREPSLVGVLLGGRAAKGQPDLATLLELSAPRAYYLCTWLPPLAESAKP